MGRLSNEQRSIVGILEGVAYIRGVLEQNVSEDSNPVTACKEIEHRLWELLDQSEDREKAEPKPAKTVRERMAERIQVDCMNLEPVGDDPAPEQETEVEPEPDEIPKAAEVPPAEVIAMHRKECKKCQFYSINTNTCDYSGRTGQIRGIPVADCEHWKDGKQRKPKVYRHICKVCGAEFRDGAARTKVCANCRERM